MTPVTRVFVSLSLWVLYKWDLVLSFIPSVFYKCFFFLNYITWYKSHVPTCLSLTYNPDSRKVVNQFDYSLLSKRSPLASGSLDYIFSPALEYLAMAGVMLRVLVTKAKLITTALHSANSR